MKKKWKRKKCKPKYAVPISSVKPTKTPKVQPITTIISTSQPEPSVPQREGKGIATDEQLKSQPKLVKASSVVRPNADALILIKKAVAEAKRFEMTKSKVIKIVQEEAKKIRIDPKKVTSVKAGENFKKAQDAEWRNNDKRNFVVHNLFKFADFRLTELDELGLIIEKKKSSVFKDLMQSLSKKYERLKKIPEELGI
uniref:Uncharacterized protein n=1 Tax=Tanacetum cinerariifolium TaxID=118510 RepID=A0A699HFU3_TANCI|nr:hypothetical protein [Tanacetum cinerariifolium]